MRHDTTPTRASPSTQVNGKMTDGGESSQDVDGNWKCNDTRTGARSPGCSGVRLRQDCSALRSLEGYQLKGRSSSSSVCQAIRGCVSDQDRCSQTKATSGRAGIFCGLRDGPLRAATCHTLPVTVAPGPLCPISSPSPMSRRRKAWQGKRRQAAGAKWDPGDTMTYEFLTRRPVLGFLATRVLGVPAREVRFEGASRSGGAVTVVGETWSSGSS